MSDLQKLVDRCNEMDITEQINWLGDAIMPMSARAELVYLQACARAVEDLSTIEATDATIAMFFKRDAPKLRKLRVAK